MLRNLWRYRSFVLGMASREFRARYMGSVLGSVWAVLHPLTLVFIYTVVPQARRGAHLGPHHPLSRVDAATAPAGSTGNRYRPCIQDPE